MQWSIAITSLNPKPFGLRRLRRRLRASGITSVAVDCSDVRRPSMALLQGLRMLAAASEREHCLASLVDVEPELLVLLDVCRLTPSFEIRPRLAPRVDEALEIQGPAACDSVSVEARWAA